MKNLDETLAAILLLLLFILALCFVFYGEPDLWDRWHSIAMGAANCK